MRTFSWKNNAKVLHVWKISQKYIRCVLKITILCFSHGTWQKAIIPWVMAIMLLWQFHPTCSFAHTTLNNSYWHLLCILAIKPNLQGNKYCGFTSQSPWQLWHLSKLLLNLQVAHFDWILSICYLKWAVFLLQFLC